MAPVAGRITDRQQDGDIPVPGRREGVVTPRVPAHRIVGVLAQVRAGLLAQPVGGRPAQCFCLTTTTGHSAWETQCSLTDPISIPVNSP